MRSQKAEQVLGAHELYVLELLREVNRQRKSESPSSRSDVRINSQTPGCSTKKGNLERGTKPIAHDEEGYRALMGYV